MKAREARFPNGRPQTPNLYPRTPAHVSCEHRIGSSRVTTVGPIHHSSRSGIGAVQTAPGPRRRWRPRAVCPVARLHASNRMGITRNHQREAPLPTCSNPCSHTADFVDVRECSPVSESLVALRIRSLANCGERAAEVWGSRGRRFKSCHPDLKQQVRGRFGQNPRRPLCCRVAIGVATAHVLTSPLLLGTAERRSARRGRRLGRARPR